MVAKHKLNSPLKRARKARRCKLFSVAAELNISIAHLCNVENGAVRASPALAARLAAFFNGEVSEMEILYPERYCPPEAAPAKAPVEP